MEKGNHEENLLQELKEKTRELEMMKQDEELAVQNKRLELEELKEDVLDAKIHRIAMGEIAKCNGESLIRSFGYVESFYGYPDMAKNGGEPIGGEKE